LVPRVESWDRFLAVAGPRPFAPGVGLLLSVLEDEVGAPVPRGVIRTLGGARLTLAPAVRWIRPSQILARVGRPPTPPPPSRILRRGVFLGSPWRAMRAAADALWPREPWLRAAFDDGSTP